MQSGSASHEVSPNGGPRRFILAGMVVIAAFFGGLGLWAAFFPFSGAVIAPGVVKVSQERKVVQHLEGGIVDEILVREGSRVNAGDLLIRLKSTTVDASVDLVQSQLWAKQAQIARLRAQVQFAPTVAWPADLLTVRERSDVRETLDNEQSVFASARDELEGKLALHQSQIRQLDERIAGALEEQQATESVIASLREELQAKEALLAGRYIDLTQVLLLRRQLAEREGARGSLRQSVAEMRQQIEELKLRSADLRNSYREKAAADLSVATDDMVALRERLRPALDSRQRLEIRAPITGDVIGLKIHSEGGGVVRPGEPLMEIVPKDSELTVESRIKPEDITRVRPGQYTRVELTAFDRREVNPLSGEVTRVSADMLSEQSAMGTQQYYQVNVRILPGELESAKVYLSPGMPAVCFISTEERTILGYLLEPLFFFLDRSLREG